MSPYLIEAEILDRPYNIMLRYTTLIIELNLHPSDTVSAVKNIHYTWFHIILTVLLYCITLMMHRGFCFSGHSVSCVQV